MTLARTDLVLLGAQLLFMMDLTDMAMTPIPQLVLPLTSLLDLLHLVVISDMQLLVHLLLSPFILLEESIKAPSALPTTRFLKDVSSLILELSQPFPLLRLFSSRTMESMML